MCGIVGYVGPQNAVSILLEGLKKLEYRGYDSSGIAVMDGGKLVVVKRTGPVRVLEAELASVEVTGTAGIAHTRWATHGEANDRNAHPHTDCSGHIAVVHNGIVTNDQAFRAALKASGHRFTSETDTEVIAHLVEEERRKGNDLLASVQNVALLLRDSSFAIAVFDDRCPDRVVAACLGSPLYAGTTPTGSFVASDPIAFREHGDEFVQIEDGHAVIVGMDGSIRVTNFRNEEVAHRVEQFYYTVADMGKTASTFMQTEIGQQPGVVRNVLDGRFLEDGTFRIGAFEQNEGLRVFCRERMTEVVFLACGTSYYASLAGERFLQSLNITARAVNAGEFATSPMRVGPTTLVVPVSQSGTTADLLVAVKRAKQQGGVIFPLVNVPGSQLSRMGGGVGMYLQAGLERGVASTKAYTAQVLTMCLLGLVLAKGRSVEKEYEGHLKRFRTGVADLAPAVTRLVDCSDTFIDLGRSLASPKLFEGVPAELRQFIFIGKGYGFPAALEGALKMSEIGYVPSMGLPAAELKHGPLALVDKSAMVVAVCFPDDEFEEVYDITHGNVAQVLSRQGRVIVVAEEGDKRIGSMVYGDTRIEHVIYVPRMRGPLSAITAVVPMQYLALGFALARGNDVDQPRNLAKSVTVR